MKICTECNKSFDDAQRFCQYDGTVLTDETDLLRASLSGEFDPDASEASDQDESVDWVPVSKPTSGWVILPVGVLIGLAIAAGLYLIWLAPALTAEKRTQDQSSAAKRQSDYYRAAQVTSFQAPPSASPIQQPSAEASPASSPIASPEVAQAKPAPPRLNEGPISTGAQQSGEETRVLINIKGVGSIEADAAWEDGGNLWYRRGSLVSSVRRDRVESITNIAQPKSAPAEGAKP